MLNLPTTRQLQYFAALAQYRHFGRAAEACFVSQPAFSIAIRELESCLAMQLVDRTNKQVTITSIGQDVAVQARLVLGDLEDLVEITRLNRSPLCGQLKLGAIPTIAPFILPGVLPKLRKAFPQLKLFLHEGLTQDVYERLMQGELDLILVALPYELRNTESMNLFSDRFFLAHKKDTKLVSGKTWSVQQLPTESIILLEDGHCLRDHALVACKIRNIEKVSRITASSLLTLIQMVDADLGVTYLPEMAVHSSLLKNTRIITSALKAGNSRDIALVWRKGSNRDEEFRMLGEFIQEHR